jgi:hypothetical protein
VLEDGMDNQARDYAQQHLETLACNDARARLHAAKELSWMTGDDSRHLGLVEGTIEANRKAVFDEVLCLTRSHRAAAVIVPLLSARLHSAGRARSSGRPDQE